MHGALMRRADVLGGCAEGSDEETEVKAIADLIEAYEAQQWPLGTNPAGSAVSGRPVWRENEETAGWATGSCQKSLRLQ